MSVVKRAEVMDGIVRATAELGGRRYFVVRGPIVFPAFDFSRHPFAASIIVADREWRPEGVELLLRVSFGTKLSDKVSDPVLETMEDDADDLIVRLRTATRAGSNMQKLVHGVIPVRAYEWYDASGSSAQKTQGVSVIFRTVY